MTYLRARYYDPYQRRFISEDPIRDGLNWYSYCGGNPVMFVDPMGLDSYIFYLSEWEDEALMDKQALMDMGISEDEIVMIPINSEQDLVDGWNGMGIKKDENGNEIKVDIDYVTINTHGDPTQLKNVDNLETGEKGWSLTSEEIGKLEDKNITGNLILYGCNAGHWNYRTSNPASAFAKKIDGSIVIASDGVVQAYEGVNLYESIRGDKDSTFNYWVDQAIPEVNPRRNKGWCVYRYDGEKVTTRIADPDSNRKYLTTSGACRMAY